MSELTVPPGYALRHASVDDADAVAGLLNAVNVAEVGVPWMSVDEVRDILTVPTRRPDDHTLLLADDGSIVGYLMVFADADPFTTIQLLSFVPPALWGRGWNAWLLRLGEERARERLAGSDATSIALRVARWTTTTAAIPLFESLGYRPVRSFHELRIDFDAPPSVPAVPDGIVIRGFDAERDARHAYETLREAFEDHWGQTFESFEDWLHEDVRSVEFDAGLWFLAFDGEEVVGALSAKSQTIGPAPVVYVSTVGVRRPWRGRGIARALLLCAFAETYRRGVRAVELGVDSKNPTGATRLYEGLGMRVIRTNEVWEKRLTTS